MNNKQKVQDKRIEKLFKKIGKEAGLSLDYSFITTENEIAGVFYDSNFLEKQIIDDYEMLVPAKGVAFLILSEEEFKNPDIENFANILRQSYLDKKDFIEDEQ